jgi:hypothetical protein
VAVTARATGPWPGGRPRERLSALEREARAVVSAVEKRRFDCPAVAVFSSRPHGLLRIWRLVEPLPGRLAVADVLDLAPIRLQLFAATSWRRGCRASTESKARRASTARTGWP